MKQIYNWDLRVAEELWERDNRTCSPRGLPVAPSQWQEGQRRRATQKESGWFRNPHFKKKENLPVRVLSLCPRRFGVPLELPVPWSIGDCVNWVIHQLQIVAWNWTRGRNESENETLDFKSFALSGNCLFENWVSCASLTLKVIRRRKNLDSPTAESQLRAYLESNLADVCINNSRLIHDEYNIYKWAWILSRTCANVRPYQLMIFPFLLIWMKPECMTQTSKFCP